MSDGSGGMLGWQRWGDLPGCGMLSETGGIGSWDNASPTAKDKQRREQGHHFETPEMRKSETQTRLAKEEKKYLQKES